MTPEDAHKRLRQCRALQPDQLQIIVSADIVDVLLGCPACNDTGHVPWKECPGINSTCGCRS